MKLASALEEVGLQLRRRRGEERDQVAAALAALREFLLDYCGHEELAAVRPGDLLQFLLDYYPAEEEPDPDVAVSLLEVVAALARWAVERGDRTLAPFLREEERLREDVARAAAALQALREHARRDDLAPPVEAESEDAPGAVVAATSGVHRVVRLDQVDYAAAEEDYFTVTAVLPAGLELSSPSRRELGEAALGPVRIPAEAAALLRPGDRLRAEVAPGPEGWELLEAGSVRPGGYE